MKTSISKEDIKFFIFVGGALVVVILMSIAHLYLRWAGIVWFIPK